MFARDKRLISKLNAAIFPGMLCTSKASIHLIKNNLL